MRQRSLDSFGAYTKARELFDYVIADMGLIEKEPKCYRLISQQVASADSICSDMEEGFGRGSSKEYVQFLRYSRGSARETLGRYERMKHWIPAATIGIRTALCGEIIAILSHTIATLERGGEKT